MVGDAFSDWVAHSTATATVTMSCALALQKRAEVSQPTGGLPKFHSEGLPHLNVVLNGFA
jgi:hypothetical protein